MEEAPVDQVPRVAEGIGGIGVLVHSAPSGDGSGIPISREVERGSLVGFIGLSEQRGCPSPRDYR